MRRLLPLVLAAALVGAPVSALASTGGIAAGASGARIAGHVPPGVQRVRITLTLIGPTAAPGRGVRTRTLTRRVAVRLAIQAADALVPATTHYACPMYMRVGPVLVVSYLSRSGAVRAQARVEVALGSKGSSGSNACFPISFTAGGRTEALLGEGYVRLMGRLLGVTIS